MSSWWQNGTVKSFDDKEKCGYMTSSLGGLPIPFYGTDVVEHDSLKVEEFVKYKIEVGSNGSKHAKQVTRQQVSIRGDAGGCDRYGLFSKDEDGSPDVKLCVRCLKEGHNDTECKVEFCFKCWQVGHQARSCSQIEGHGGSVAYNGNKPLYRCVKCQDYHESKSCP